MAKKTAIRRAAPYLPLTVQAQTAASNDDTTPDYGDVFQPVLDDDNAEDADDVTAEVMEADTPEDTEADAKEAE